jgi:hypothetical protein
MTHDNHGGPARARKQTQDSGANSGADTTTIIDKGMKHHQHLFGSKNDGVGGAKETGGKVNVHDESRGGKSRGSW